MKLTYKIPKGTASPHRFFKRERRLPSTTPREGLCVSLIHIDNDQSDRGRYN